MVSHLVRVLGGRRRTWHGIAESCLVNGLHLGAQGGHEIVETVLFGGVVAHEEHVGLAHSDLDHFDFGLALREDIHGLPVLAL